MTESYEVTAEQFSSDQPELVNPPSNQKYMQTAPSTEKNLKTAKYVSGSRSPLHLSMEGIDLPNIWKINLEVSPLHNRA